MSSGWMRVREAAGLMGVSQTTVRRRIEGGDLRGREGKSGRQEVFLPAKLRRECEARLQPAQTPQPLQCGNDAEAPISVQKPAAAPKQAEPAEASTPGKGPARTDSNHDDDVVKRYERLAGGSLMLAQQHSDELKKHAKTAYEQLAHTRSQMRMLRRVALAGWAGCGAAALFAVLLAIGLGVGKARAEARAEASEHIAEQAERQVRDLTDVLAQQPAEAASTATRSASVPTTDEVLFPGR